MKRVRSPIQILILRDVADFSNSVLRIIANSPVDGTPGSLVLSFAREGIAGETFASVELDTKEEAALLAVLDLGQTSLVMGTADEEDETLRVHWSNRGEPYREVIAFHLEKGAHGDYSNYQVVASIDLEYDAYADLRNLLQERAMSP